MKKVNTEDNLIIRIATYGYSNEVFSINDLINNKVLKAETKDDKVIYPEYDYIIKTLFNRGVVADNPNHIATIVKKGDSLLTEKYTLLPSAYFSYLDYIELKEARKQSKAANIQSKWAIAISLLSLFASIVIGIWEKIS